MIKTSDLLLRSRVQLKPTPMDTTTTTTAYRRRTRSTGVSPMIKTRYCHAVVKGTIVVFGPDWLSVIAYILDQ
jgi:hypothetical protein